MDRGSVVTPSYKYEFAVPKGPSANALPIEASLFQWLKNTRTICKRTHMTDAWPPSTLPLSAFYAVFSEVSSQHCVLATY